MLTSALGRPGESVRPVSLFDNLVHVTSRRAWRSRRLEMQISRQQRIAPAAIRNDWQELL